MRLEPRKNWINARAIVRKQSELVIDPTKGITRCFLIEAVGPDVKDYLPGDIVVAIKVYDMFMHTGAHQVTFPADEVIQQVVDFDLSQFVGVDGKPVVRDSEAA